MRAQRILVAFGILALISIATAVVAWPRPAPASATGAAGLGAGFAHTCALTTAGGVKCWGDNGNGELGDGQACGTSCTTPVDVVGLTTGVATVAAGNAHACAVTATGALKCWGYNMTGKVGDGTTTNRTTPVDVVGLGSAVAGVDATIYHTCAVSTGGGLKCWGDNGYGKLGDGTTTARHTPVDVCATEATPPCTPANNNILTGVTSVATGWDHTCALTTAGGVKCWGDNGSGELGDGQACGIPCTTPVDVSGLGPKPVGGIAELPEVAGASLETEGSSGSNVGALAGSVAGVVAGAIALGGAAWYARRRLR